MPLNAELHKRFSHLSVNKTAIFIAICLIIIMITRIIIITIKQYTSYWALEQEVSVSY